MGQAKVCPYYTMNSVLAIDPGETTGTAILSLKDFSVFIASYSIDALLRSLTEMPYLDLILIEGTPAFSSNKDQNILHSRVSEVVMSLNVTYYVVYPGAWKPIAKAQGWKVPQAVNQHEKDAFNILRHVMLSPKYNLDISRHPFSTRRLP
jgi:hypothetical protein